MDSLIEVNNLDPELFVPLHNMLEMITIPLSSKNNRKGFGVHRNACFGLVKDRRTRNIGMSVITKKYPEIWEELQKIGTLFLPLGFTFSSVHLNHNVSCGPHRDKHNVGYSVIVAFGDYEGGHLLTEHGHDINTNCNAVLFDGKATTHWNSPLTSGNKYSLVFYTHECAYQYKA